MLGKAIPNLDIAGATARKALFDRVVAAIVRRISRLQRFRLSHALEDAKNLRLAFATKPRPGSVLVVEPNEFHAETLPGYLNLLERIGFECWVLCRPRVDIDGALSRLTFERDIKVFRMNLWFMKCFLRSKLANDFDLVFFNSGVIAEKFGYFGGVFEFLGAHPKTPLGYLMIEHSDEHFRERCEPAQINRRRHFALRDVDQEGVKLEMLAPVEFGPVTVPKRGETAVFITVGSESGQRNLDLLADSVRRLRAEHLGNFEVLVIGNIGRRFLSSVDREVINFLGFKPFSEMYDLVEQAHFFLPLLDARLADHSEFLHGVTSGSRQLILGFQKIGIIDEVFAEAYGFSAETSVLYKPGDLLAGMRAALVLDDEAYSQKVAAVGRLKRATVDSSLSNLRRFLVEYGAEVRQ